MTTEPTTAPDLDQIREWAEEAKAGGYDHVSMLSPDAVLALLARIAELEAGLAWALVRESAAPAAEPDLPRIVVCPHCGEQLSVAAPPAEPVPPGMTERSKAALLDFTFDGTSDGNIGRRERAVLDAEPVPLTLDAERLRTIFEARMPDGCYILSDDGQGFSIVSPSSLADQIAHLYQTGDVLSGLAALRTTSSEGQDR